MATHATYEHRVDQRIRLILRIHALGNHHELELAIPATARLGEVLPEVVHLTEILPEDQLWETSWQFSTAVGLPLSATKPLLSLGVHHGDVIVIEPRKNHPAPVVRDCADAISDRTHSLIPRIPAARASWLFALLALIALGWRCNLPLWSIAAGVAVVSALELIWACLPITISLTTSLSASLSTYLLVLQGTAPPSPPSDSAHTADIITDHTSILWEDHGFALLCALGVFILVTSALAALHTIPLPMSTALLSAAGGGLVGAGVLAWSGNLCTTGSVLLLITLLGCLSAPKVALVLADVPLPVLPAAGEDLTVSDIDTTTDTTAVSGARPRSPAQPSVKSATRSSPDPQRTIRQTAQRATQLHEGLLAGLGVLATLSTLIVSIHSGLFSQATCLAAAGCFILHALRHCQQSASWALFVPGLSSLAGVAIAAHHASSAQETASLVLGILAAISLASVSVWVGRLKDLTPTTQMWLERAETVCLAALIPLSAHVAGLFYFIRSLG